MRFNMFRHYEGYSVSGYGSQTDCYEFVEIKDGKLLFNAKQGHYTLRITPDEFINGLDETYLNAYHRYQLAENNEFTRQEIEHYIRHEADRSIHKV